MNAPDAAGKDALAQLPEIIEAIRSAFPGLPEALIEGLARSEQARKRGLFPASRQQLDRLHQQYPQHPVVRREQILLHLAAEEHAQAEALLVQESARVPEDRWVWSSLAACRRHQGNGPGEAQALQRVLALRAEETPARRLFELLRDAGDMRGAMDVVVMLRDLRDTPELQVAHVRLLAHLQQSDEALALAESLVQADPPVAGIAEQWAQLVMARPGGPEQVVERCQALATAAPLSAALLVAWSRALHRLERDPEAIARLQQALALEPGHAPWWYDLAVLQRQVGQVAESQLSFERAMAIDPLNPTTLRVHGVEHRHHYGEEPMRRIHRALAGMEDYPLERQVELHYAAAKAYEDVGETEAAFDHYRVAGRKQAKVSPYRHSAAISLLRTLRQGMRPETYERFAEERCDSALPVFVLGMPRSGTTLTEQIIASHPQAHGAGELKLLHRVLDGIAINGTRIQTSADGGVIPTYIPGLDLECTTLGFKARGERLVEGMRRLAAAAGRPDALRVVDKMPGNYFWAGMVPLILPNARIIHTRRHPMDCALSNYRIFFPDGMPWSYDLRNLGKCYRAYHEHMQHWESNLPPGMLLSVRYEETVADFEHQARRIVAHTGLPWDDACLRFYETERSVKTASLTQVRQPIYTRSVGKWRQYEAHLQPLLNEIRPLVEAYEAELHALNAARPAAPEPDIASLAAASSSALAA